MKHVIVVGAGASGMMAAITAAKAGCKVTILEHTSKSGRKIEITGNGKCNYTNAYQSMECYHSENPEYVKEILEAFSYEDTLTFFRELGIIPKEKNGYYYPYSGQAQAVSSALRMEAERWKVKFACNIKILDIRKKQSQQGFEIVTEGYTYTADRVILATGSMAAPTTGSDGSGYALAQSLGHDIRKPLPALVQLLSKDKELDVLSGLRMDGSATLCVDGKNLVTEFGEIQFIKNGLSGIPVFQLSGQAARYLDLGRRVTVKINFLAGIGWEDICKELMVRKKQSIEKQQSVQQCFNGILHERAQKAVLNKTKLKGSKRIEELDEKAFLQLYQMLTDMEFVINRTNSFEQAQVCSGGVLLSQLKKGTLESEKVEGLYFAGELLDVDGLCGGYNLQWAWASGYVAGSSASQ